MSTFNPSTTIEFSHISSWILNWRHKNRVWHRVIECEGSESKMLFKMTVKSGFFMFLKHIHQTQWTSYCLCRQIFILNLSRQRSTQYTRKCSFTWFIQTWFFYIFFCFRWHCYCHWATIRWLHPLVLAWNLSVEGVIHN